MITTLVAAGLKNAGDGTSNGSLTQLVDRIVAGSLVISVGIFIVVLMIAAWGKAKGTGRFEAGGGRNGGNPFKTLMPPAAAFVVLSVLLAGVWALMKMAGGLSSGLFG